MALSGVLSASLVSAALSTSCSPGVAGQPGAPSLEIQSRVADGSWTSEPAIYPLRGQAVTLRVEERADARIRWYQVFPVLDELYKNANHPWEDNPYEWVGLDTIDYSRVELTHLEGQWAVRPLDQPRADPSGSRFHQRALGSFWFQAVVETDTGTLHSPGLESNDGRGLSPAVLRVSVRSDEGYLGTLVSFFNVPGLFGSVVHQSEHYIGVDCADVLVAAYHRWKGTPLGRNHNVAMLVDLWPRVLEIDLDQGEPSGEVLWGEQLRPGDVIAVRYAGKKQYQHIGALYQDADSDGRLSGDDLVLHAGPTPLHLSRLEDGGFDGHVVVMRPE